MKKLTDLIKHHAIEYGISLFKERCGIRSDNSSYFDFKKSLDDHLPKFSHLKVNGRVDSIETTSYASSDGYYPNGSFYRVSIIYSGHLDNGKWFFRNCTAHYNEEMEFISLQGHFNSSDDGWDLFDQLKLVVSSFKNITLES